jgi:hypothetical protein
VILDYRRFKAEGCTSRYISFVILDYRRFKAEGVEIIVPNNPNERYYDMVLSHWYKSEASFGRGGVRGYRYFEDVKKT